MNYYRHHLGDYAAATAHLSWDEDMAYTRLIRVYYQHERPIPADLAQAARLVRATTPAQRRAVETVLREFFDLEPDGWHQKRCDEEIAVAQEKAERNRDVGRMGGRPRKTETQTEPTRNPDGFQTVDVGKPRANPSQEPIASGGSPSGEHAKRRGKPPAPLPDWLPPADWEAFVAHRRSLKAPLTDDGQRRAIAALSALRDQGNDPARVIDRTIVRGWKGFFPLPENEPPRSTTHGPERFSPAAANARRLRELEAGVGARTVDSEAPHEAHRDVRRELPETLP